MKNPNRQVWFISDTHFGHHSIIEHCRPQFKNVVEMEDCIITMWNQTVGKNDLVYHLGDFSIHAKDAVRVRPLLNGHIRLIVGNHDDIPKLAEARIFQRMALWRQFPEYGFHATHVPLRQNQIRHSSLNVHGHVHGDTKGLESFHRDVSVESINYTPVSCWELKKWAANWRPKSTAAAAGELPNDI